MGMFCFTSEEAKISDQSDEFLINVGWVDGGGSGGSNKRNINRRRSRKRAPLNVSKKLSLDVLFDEKTGKTSKPNIPLIKADQNNTEETLLCANCFVNGEATINMVVGGNFFPFKLTQASISVKGNIKLNLDFSINGKVGASLSPPDLQLLSIPLSPLGVTNLFNIGPSIDLGASAQVSADVTGTLFTGGEIDIPNFDANFTFVDDPNLVQTGFEPQTKSHDPTVGVTISTGISGSLKPQLSFGLDILNGLFSIKTGFEVITTLGTSVSVGSESGCNRDNQPHLQSTLEGDLGFFVASKDFPIVNFPTVTLLNQCVSKVN
ncbi:apple protein [Rhizophagus clarus]|uniref:Apple protein n=1 Tax=Rhizophagus clarus TaxID=94130 RepID=A0A8H3LFQ3_9GLOM|nr:apple protein [Rhizophagus clarus]